MYFWTYGIGKTWLDKYLKNPVSEDNSTTNMETRRNTAEIWMTEPLPYLLIPLKEIQVEKVSLSDMQNLRTVC